MSTNLRFPNVFVLPDGRMDAKNSAAYLGLSPKTLAMKRCSGTGPRFIKRGRVFYFKAELDLWLQESSAMSTAKAGAGRRPS